MGADIVGLFAKEKVTVIQLVGLLQLFKNTNDSLMTTHSPYHYSFNCKSAKTF